MNKIIIAIDGYSSCGKSTLAKRLASTLGYTFVDTGAMYRAVTLYLIDQQIDLSNINRIAIALQEITIRLQREDDKNVTFLNGINVENSIRSMKVANHVSQVAAIPIVRHFLVQQQRQMGEGRGIVMDGRDIGSIVFPHAELKLFISASVEKRTERRFLELKSKGIEANLEEVKSNLIARDFKDANRSHSPLIKVYDAIEIDNTDLTIEATFDIALRLAKNAIYQKSFATE